MLPNECQAVKERKALTDAILAALYPRSKPSSDGSEKHLNAAFDTLRGVIAEYQDGGDQMVEDCTCGKHTDSCPGHPAGPHDPMGQTTYCDGSCQED